MHETIAGLTSLVRSVIGAGEASLSDVLSLARTRIDEERLYVVEQLLGTLDPERRLRALSNEDAWREVEEDCGYFQSRRLAREYPEIFEAAGFEVVDVEVLDRAEVAANVRAALSPPYQDLPDEAIDPIDVAIALRKPT